MLDKNQQSFYSVWMNEVKMKKRMNERVDKWMDERMTDWLIINNNNKNDNNSLYLPSAVCILQLLVEPSIKLSF